MLGCHEFNGSAAIQLLSIYLRVRIIRGETCPSQVNKLIAIGRELHPELADLSRKQRGRRSRTCAITRDAKNGAIYRSCKQNCSVGAPCPLRDVWNLDDCFGSSPRGSYFLQFSTRPKADEL